MEDTVKNKRQIYLWAENKDFWDNLPNKSKFINRLIIKYRQENNVDGTATSAK